MKQAIVAIEDKRFYEHRGIDVHGIARAVWQDVRNKKVVEGGSTITQQFVKNTYLHEQALDRPQAEGGGARLADRAAVAEGPDPDRLPEHDLLRERRLRDRAARRRRTSSTAPAKLTLAEAALLAGIPSDPSLYDPVTDPKAARQRRHEVLQAMLDQGDITYNEYRLANRTPLPKPEDIHQLGLARARRQYFVDYVKQQLVDRYGSGRVFGGGLQRADDDRPRPAAAAPAQAISKWLSDPYGPAAALVALDPRDGRVLAMVGGENYRESQFNLAVQGERQPGSSFKPFVLATALEQGIAPSTQFESKPVTISARRPQLVRPQLRGLRTSARIDLTNATIYSDNTVYAQLTQLVQPKAIVDVAHRLGITSPLKNYFAIGLGAEAVNPLEMARAYAAFANGGNRVDGSIFRNRPRVILVRQRQGQRRPRAGGRSPRPTRSDGHLGPPAGRPASAPASAPQLPDAPGRRQDRHDRELRRRLVRRLHAAARRRGLGRLPEHAEADADRVQRRRGRRRNLPGADLQELHGEGAPLPARRPAELPGRPACPAPTRGGSCSATGSFQLDNGVCRNTISVEYFVGRGPAKTANCKPNEVEVPNVVGTTYDVANDPARRRSR